MTEELRGKSIQEARAMLEGVIGMLTGQAEEPTTDEVGKLAVFSGVREYPMRVKCATLVWHTLQAALEDRHQRVSTEEDQ